MNSNIQSIDDQNYILWFDNNITMLPYHLKL